MNKFYTFFASVIILGSLLQTPRIITAVETLNSTFPEENATLVPTFVDPASESAQGERNVLLIDEQKEQQWKTPTQNTQLRDLQDQQKGLATQNRELTEIRY